VGTKTTHAEGCLAREALPLEQPPAQRGHFQQRDESGGHDQQREHAPRIARAIDMARTERAAERQPE
jgi:hypothetical protein